ncbi:hypothetical protein PG996_009990 [Apiospora saccharicola]|uniref:Uncharacterized protein n=1 Tax=Apiospora saccharicola TaxID=335842 RepID=A0ABR1UMA4_9PEZI
MCFGSSKRGTGGYGSSQPTKVVHHHHGPEMGTAGYSGGHGMGGHHLGGRTGRSSGGGMMGSSGGGRMGGGGGNMGGGVGGGMMSGLGKLAGFGKQGGKVSTYVNVSSNIIILLPDVVDLLVLGGGTTGSLLGSRAAGVGVGVGVLVIDIIQLLVVRVGLVLGGGADASLRLGSGRADGVVLGLLLDVALIERGQECVADLGPVLANARPMTVRFSKSSRGV